MPYRVGKQTIYAGWEIAQRLGVSTRTVQRWVAWKLAKAYRVDLHSRGRLHVLLFAPRELRRIRRVAIRGGKAGVYLRGKRLP